MPGTTDAEGVEARGPRAEKERTGWLAGGAGHRSGGPSGGPACNAGHALPDEGDGAGSGGWPTSSPRDGGVQEGGVEIKKLWLGEDIKLHSKIILL